jgi:hypothetical protein
LPQPRLRLAHYSRHHYYSRKPSFDAMFIVALRSVTISPVCRPPSPPLTPASSIYLLLVCQGLQFRQIITHAHSDLSPRPIADPDTLLHTFVCYR